MSLLTQRPLPFRMAEDEVQVQDIEEAEEPAFTQEEVKAAEIKVFGKWSTDVEIHDMSLAVSRFEESFGDQAKFMN